MGELELANNGSFPVRIYNPYKKADVYELANGSWQKVDFLNRGGYIQVTMSGLNGTYAVVDTADRGTSVSAWANIHFLGKVAADATTATFAIPGTWIANGYQIRKSKRPEKSKTEKKEKSKTKKK